MSLRVVRASGLLTVVLSLTGSAGAQTQTEGDAIRGVIAARQRAWNAGDEGAYGRLLTPDADIISSSGRAAHGREGVVALYAEQRRGVFAGATTSTTVTRVRLVTPDVAIVDVRVVLSGLKGATEPRRTNSVFILVKQQETWLITAQRAGTATTE
jgi:uncharacterized protein (TIGR02246 family)